MKNGRSKIVYAIILMAILFGGWKLLSPTRQTWTAFYYPESSDKSLRIVSLEMEQLGQCYDWIEKKQSSRQDEDSAFECGKNCKFNEEWREYVCEIVVKK